MGKGKMSYYKDRLTNLAIGGRRVGTHLSTKNIGQGFNKHVSAEDTLINVGFSLSETR